MALASHAELNAITSRIIGAAIEVHRRLGAGLLESVYCVCLAYELRKAGLDLETDKTLPPCGTTTCGWTVGFAWT